MRIIAITALALLALACSKDGPNPHEGAVVEVHSDDVSVKNGDAVEETADADSQADQAAEAPRDSERTKVTVGSDATEVEVGNTRVKTDDKGGSVETGDVKVDRNGVEAGNVRVTPNGISIGR